MEGIAGTVWEMAYSVRTDDRWSKNGVLQRVSEGFADGRYRQDQNGKRVPGQHYSEGAPGRNGCFKAYGRQSIGRSRGGLTTKIHMVTASDRAVVGFSLSGGQAHDVPEGIALLSGLSRAEEQKYLLMGRAYEGENVREAAIEKGFVTVVPPKKNRKAPWDYDEERYKRRNEIERYFLRLKRFRRIFTRYDKLDILICGFIYFVMICDAIL